MRKTCCIGSIVILLFFFQAVHAGVVCAIQISHPECAYGVFDAWFSRDMNSWLNSTIDSVQLSRGEIFYVKTYIAVKEGPVWVALLFFEPGVTSEEQATYEILNGPTALCRMMDLGKFEFNESQTIIWMLRVKPDAKWVNATAPLNIGAFYDVKENGMWSEKDITFTIMNAFIYADGNDSIQNNNSLIPKDILHTSNIVFLLLCGSLVFFGVIIFYVFKKRYVH